MSRNQEDEVIYEVGTLTNTEGCIRGMYGLSNGNIIVQFIKKIECVRIVSNEEELITSFSGERIFIRELSHLSSLHNVLPFQNSPTFVLVYSGKISLHHHDFRLTWEASNCLEKVSENDLESVNRRNKKEIRHRTTIKNPLLLNDRFVILVVKKKCLMIHDLTGKKSTMIRPLNSISVLRIRKFDDSQSRVAVMILNRLKMKEVQIIEILPNIEIGASIKYIQFIPHPETNDGGIFMGACQNHLIGFSKKRIFKWSLGKHEHEEKSHDIPIYGIFGSASSEGNMVVASSLDNYADKTEEIIQESGLRINPDNINCNFYLHINLSSLETKIIGRVNRKRSSRGYPILYLPNYIIYLTSPLQWEEKRKKKRKKKKKQRYNPSERNPNWVNPNENHDIWVSIMDRRDEKIVVCEKRIQVSRVNDCPAVIYLTRSRLILIGNKIFRMR